jgi:Uma2 family endonuclease
MAQRAFPLVRVADDLELLPDDGNRYEILDGVLHVTPAPAINHQRLLGQLYIRLHAYAAANGLEVLMAPVDVRASEVTQVQPDLLVLPQHFPEEALTRWVPMARVVLTIEILSPSTTIVDRGRKRRLYVEEGVTEYWIVDPKRRCVEIWRADAASADVVTDTLIWQPWPSEAPLQVDLPALFAGSARCG